jgi:hypothetical protein
MANSTSIQIMQDGQRNVIVKVEGVLDTADISGTTLQIDPATLSNMIEGVFAAKAKYLKICRILYNIEDTLSVNLFWDASTPVRIEELVGRGKMDYNWFGGITQNTISGGIPAGSNGKITVTTQGWAASAVLSFSVILELEKILL